MPNLVELKLQKQSKTLQLIYDDGSKFSLSAEYLRVSSPSAEVRGHGKGQEVLQYGKKDVGINALEAVGNYALKIDFDDGHNSGLFTWPYLRELCEQQQERWENYLDMLHRAGKSREAEASVVKFKP